ncbi:hypothetical protein [Sphingomonas sp. BK235]|uniref:hypothetical protein n=1 Tax=Sphingomonas sp. BK235 TaxID=2512131 RepID=UPI001045B019|nr:hypothetical protein [Sphingomonas sp. BK235]TCP33656.1 hypothetical protein EV292_105105 [Sphingomonas sp. BK235]
MFARRLHRNGPIAPNRRAGVAWLAALLILVTLGLATPAAPAPPAAPSASGDAALYRAIDRRVRAGEGYYAAAADEQRRRDFPLRPFVTVRLPTRAWIYAALGPGAALLLLRALALLTLLATVRRLLGATVATPLAGAAAVLAAASILPLATPVVALWPECWAGLLVALSLAVRGARGWRLAALLGLAAALFREFALVYLAMMAVAALTERRRGEALGWLAAGGVAGIALAAHALAVADVVRAGDAASPGWVRAGGWGFDLAMARATTPLALLPAAAAALLVPLALYGWASAAGGYARRVTLTLLAWLLAGLIVGRAENAYWGLMLAPLWLAGLPLALAPLLRTAARDCTWRIDDRGACNCALTARSPDRP